MAHTEKQPVPQDTSKTVLVWEVAGIVLICLMGASLHFVFAWSGYWRPAGLIAAVNESTWEHFKIAFWPAFFYALLEYPFLRNRTHNFWVAKCAAFLTMPLVTFVLFYGYTAIIGHHYLFADVVIFILSVSAGQLVSYKILTSGQITKRPIHGLALAMITILVLAFSLLSYYPPRNFVFQHPESDEYGILESYQDHDHEAEHEP